MSSHVLQSFPSPEESDVKTTSNCDSGKLYSNISKKSKRKAVFIGIRYLKLAHEARESGERRKLEELQGSYNDAKRFHDFVTAHFHIPKENVMFLTDEPSALTDLPDGNTSTSSSPITILQPNYTPPSPASSPSSSLLRSYDNTQRIRSPSSERSSVISEKTPPVALMPTAENIEKAMKWLVDGATADDSLLLFFSGHGSEVEDQDGDEGKKAGKKGSDQAIVSCDNIPIIDDDMYRIMVKELTAGVRLTCIFDCCYSGSMLDGPFSYKLNGKSKEKEREEFEKKSIWAPLWRSSKSFFGYENPTVEWLKENRGSNADVFCIASSQDTKESPENSNALGGAQGTLVDPLISIINNNRSITYLKMLNYLTYHTDIFEYKNKPQLSTNRWINVEKAIFGI